MTAKVDVYPWVWDATLGASGQPRELADNERVMLVRPQYFDRLVLEAWPDANAITFQNRGWLNAPVLDSVDISIAAPTNSPYARIQTGAVSGNSGGIRPANYGGNGESVRTEWLPDYCHRFGMGASIASIRSWQGLSSAALDAVATPTTQHVAAFRFDTGVDGTNFWRTVTCDGASNVTTTTTTVAMAINTYYKLRIEFTSASECTFWINDVLVATHTTNLPGSTTLISAFSRIATLTSQLRRAQIGRVAVGYAA